MRIYYVRHGQTDWNKRLLLQGGTNIPLNETGRADAVRTGQGLAEIPFDLCISSPLDRAMETAVLILSENHAPRGSADWPSGTRTERNGVRFFIDERLREYCFGVWEKQCFKGPGKTIPIGNYPDFWSDEKDRYTPEGAEPKQKFYARVRSILDELNELFGKTDANILVVAHGGVSRAVRYVLTCDPKQAAVNTRNCEALVLTPNDAGQLFIAEQIYLGEDAG